MVPGARPRVSDQDELSATGIQGCVRLEESNSMTISQAGADNWLRNYGKAWEEAAPQRAGELFTEDCRYYETPFSEPEIGRDGVAKYWQDWCRQHKRCKAPRWLYASAD